MKKIREETESSLKQAAEQIKVQYDKHRKPSRTYKEGDMVYMEAVNVKLDQPMKKLSDKRLGPFKVLKKVGPLSYKLDLPVDWKVYPVINETFLTPHKAPTFPTQREKKINKPTPVIVKGNNEWE